MRAKEMFRGALLGGVLNVEGAYLSLWMQVLEIYLMFESMISLWTDRPPDILDCRQTCTIQMSERISYSDSYPLFLCPAFFIISAAEPPGLLSVYHLLFPL